MLQLQELQELQEKLFPSNTQWDKLCYKGIIKLQVQEIQSFNQKHSEVWPAFL